MMKEYIIDPMVFYWISVIIHLRVIAGIFLFGSVGAMLCVGFRYCAIKDAFDRCEERDYDYDGKKKRYQSIKQCFKKSIIFVIVSSILFLFVPGERTMYRMLIASTLTKQNIEVTRDFIIETIDKAVNKIVERDDTK